MAANGESVRARPQEVTPQNHDVFILSYSAWFKYASINDVEKRAMPEYFTGESPSKTPEAYKTIRNFIIDLYRHKPTEYLKSTSPIHSLLEEWGLINYRIESKERPKEFE